MNSVVKISCNWDETLDISKCCSIISEREFHGFNEDSLDASNCVQIDQCSAGSNPDPLQLNISLEKDAISRLVLVSQCKRIEIFNASGSGAYIKTMNGTLSDASEDDFKVFTIDDVLDTPGISEIVVKMTGVLESCWILNVVIVTAPMIMNKFDRFDLSSINPDLPLSDKAKDFKKLFETFQKTSSIPPTDPHPDMIKSMMSMSTIQNVQQHDCKDCASKIDALEAKIMLKFEEQDAKLSEILNLLKK